MSLEENKEIIRRYVDIVNRGQFDELDALVIPDFVDHNPVPGQGPGLAGAKVAYAMIRDAFPDAVFDLQDLIAEGDKVVGRGVMHGTHRGNFLGIPGTGRPVTWTGIRIFTVRDGKVTEGWIDLDLLSVVQQIGAFPPPTQPANTEDSKAVYRRFVEEVINQGRYEVIPELFAPDYLDHNLPPGAAPGLDSVRQVQSMFRNAFPDVHFTIEDMVSEGDRVATRVTGTGTQNGEFTGIPPSGRRATWSSMGFFRVANGKIVEHWGIPDLLGLMQQLGATIVTGQGRT